MKYTDLIPGKIYKCWFRSNDYWVIRFTRELDNGYFKGERVYIGKEKGGSFGLNNFKWDWKFGDPSTDDLEAFYKQYGYGEAILQTEIY